jgi:hypothetical protein
MVISAEAIHLGWKKLIGAFFRTLVRNTHFLEKPRQTDPGLFQKLSWLSEIHHFFERTE